MLLSMLFNTSKKKISTYIYMLYEENEKIYYLCEYILHKFIGKLKSKDLIWFLEKQSQ